MTQINQLMVFGLGVVIGGFFAGKSFAGTDAAGHWTHTGSVMQTVGGIEQVGINKEPGLSPRELLEAVDANGIIRATENFQLRADYDLEFNFFNPASNQSYQSQYRFGQTLTSGKITISAPDKATLDRIPLVRFLVEAFNGRVLVANNQHPAGLETFPGTRQFQVHGGIRGGSLGLGVGDNFDSGWRLHVRSGSIVSENNIGVGPDYDITWIDTGTKTGVGAQIAHSASSNSLTFISQPPEESVSLAGQIAKFEPSGRILVGFPDHNFGDADTTLMQVHGITRTSAIVVGGTSSDEEVDPACPLDVLGEARIGVIPQDDTLDKVVVWDDATGKLRYRAAATLGGGPCTNCVEVQTAVFDAVCKIFEGELGNVAQVTECVTVIAPIALVRANPCETDCLSTILDNVVLCN